VKRSLVESIATGVENEMPSLALAPSGEVDVAWIHYDPQDQSERVWVRHASANAPLGKPFVATEGLRAAHPRLAVAADGSLWLAWCGRNEETSQHLRDDYASSIWLRKIRPLAKAIEISPQRTSPRERHCNADLHIDNSGKVHVAWELSRESVSKVKSASSSSQTSLETAIGYRTFIPQNGELSGLQLFTAGPLNRRPRIISLKAEVFVAWDALVSNAPHQSRDPDYDVMLRKLDSHGTAGKTVVVDAGEGIQAAPELETNGRDTIYIAYHSSENHPLVKVWRVRAFHQGKLYDVQATNPLHHTLDHGTQQGAEFPALAVTKTGALVITSRPSQGAYLQWIDDKGVSDTFDLTREDWGARGLFMQLAVTDKLTAVIARRARHEPVLEHIDLGRVLGSAPKLVPIARDTQKSAHPLRKHSIRQTSFLPQESAKQSRLLLGDVHMHSGMSDGTGPADEVYARAFVRGLDFAILTDHHYAVGSRMLPSEHEEIAWITDFFGQLPNFITLHAYEWTTPAVPRGAGHRNVYFKDYAPTPVYGYKDGYPTTLKLQEALKHEHAFTAPHHTGWTGTDWSAADPAIQRHFEIVSVHGAFERLGNTPIASRGTATGMFAIDGLTRGLKFGFLGGSDAHGLLWHHGVGRRADPWDHGLTGVLLDAAPSRHAVWDALYARRTFATSGARMFASFSVHKVGMGQEGDSPFPAKLHYSVQGTRPLESVDLIRDGHLVHTIRPTGDSARGIYQDHSVLPGKHFYYLRAVEGKGTEHADILWTSPCFVTITR